MKKSNLLFQEPPLVVSPSLAKLIGLNESIIVQQLHYWLTNPKAGTERNGEKWIYNTYEEWQSNFPFWSVYQIQRIFLGLEKLGIIISAQLDAKSRVQTKFYRLDYDKLCMMDDAILRPSNHAELHDVNNESETTTDIIKAANKTVDEILRQELNPLGLEKIAMQKRFEKAFKINPNWDGTLWRDFDGWLLSQQRKGRTVEDWAVWWNSDDFRRDKQTINLTPSKIKQNWNLAFESQIKITQDVDGGFYG